MRTSEFIDTMIKPRDVRLLPIPVMQAVMAMRLCVICHKVDRDPLDDLIPRFGSTIAARRFQVVFEVIGSAWPDPFMVSRPCCPMLGPDEMMFADMIAAASIQDRSMFDRITREMHNTDIRETLFTALSAFEQARAHNVD